MSGLQQLYGMLARFPDAERLKSAVEELHRRGYRKMDAFTPFPVEGLAEATGLESTGMSLVVLLGCLFGGIAGFAFQWWVAVIAYPLDIGGRPLNSWPSFIPITFEMTILGGALAAVLGMLGLNGLPCPHHPLFEIDAFQRATSDAFFVCVTADDPQFQAATTRDILNDLQAVEVWDVPAAA